MLQIWYGEAMQCAAHLDATMAPTHSPKEPSRPPLTTRHRPGPAFQASMSTPADFRSIVDLQQAGQLEAAETALRAWIAQRPGHGEAHARLGMVLQAAGRPQEALPCLEAAVRLEPGNPQPLCLLGALCHTLGRLEQAAASYRKAVAIAPRLARAYNNLALVLKEQGDPDGAVAVLRSVLSFMPDYATALNNLGSVLADAGRDSEALVAFRAAAARAPQSVEAWRNLGSTLARLGQPAEAIPALETALRLQPGQPVALRMALARMLAAANRSAQARALYAAVLAEEPGNLQAAIGARLTLPLVYRSRADIERAREGFHLGLAELEAECDRQPDGRPEHLLAQLAWVNFPLAYQGQDDRELQSRYGQLVTRLLRRALPALMAERAGPPGDGRRLRVGFASSLFHRGTVCSYFASWVTGLDKDQFETFVYHAGSRQDAATRELALACGHYLHLPLSAAGAALRLARRIAADALDILVYPELGMTAELFPLAALRLAPVQCAAWGHPVTTGLPNIDYFLSSEPMEAPGAQAQYTERLVGLPGLGTSYRRPALPAPGSRADFGLPQGRRLYLFPHAPFKIHPANDALLAEIALRDADAVFVLVQGRQAALTHAFLARFDAALAANGVPPGQRTCVLPYLPHDDYLRLNQLCDVMLDSLYWSGGNTTLDAIACGLPVVTLPGATMRSRQSAAMLRLAGVDELVADDGAAYVERALGIAGDPDQRARLRERLQLGAAALFGQAHTLAFLQDTLRELVRPAPPG
jgi:CRISPR-associated protein Csy1